MKNWIQLSPYGTFSHPEGQQTLSESDAQHFVQRMKTLRFRLRLKQIPVYLGHPDDPFFKDLPEHSDQHVYGHLKGIRADQDGLSVQIRWTKIGRRFLQNHSHYYLSPRWVLSKTEGQTTYHPETLLSVGLTKHPNLPVQPMNISLPLPFLKQIWEKIRTWIAKLFFRKSKKKSTPSIEKPSVQIPAPAPHTVSITKDLHGAQTREEKCRILRFGQQIQARMKRTGESYPEAWHALYQEQKNQNTSSPTSAIENNQEQGNSEPKRTTLRKRTKRNLLKAEGAPVKKARAKKVKNSSEQPSSASAFEEKASNKQENFAIPSPKTILSQKLSAKSEG